MLTLRQRKAGGVWYVRGAIKIGKASRQIGEHSTGTASWDVADSYRSTLQTKIERELLYGVTAPREIGWDTTALAYAQRGLSLSEKSRLGILNDYFAGTTLNHLALDEWNGFVRASLAGRAGNTIHNYRKTFRAIFRAGGLPPPEIPPTRDDTPRERWLTRQEADTLLNAYTPRFRPVALIARYQGLRANEIAALERRDIDLAHNFLVVRKSKTGRSRRLPLHPSAAAWLEARLASSGAPSERLFTRADGAPYPDGRISGHNPFDGAHRRACKKAGIKDFTFHDWRHSWATWFMIEGGDLRSLMALGGWSNIRMVEMYAAVDMEHAGRLQARIA